MDRNRARPETSVNASENALRNVLSIEQQAREIIEDAEAEAKRIVARATRRAHEIQEQANQDAQRKAQEAIQEARLAAEQLSRDILAQAEHQVADWETRAWESLAPAAQWVCDYVVQREMSDGSRS